MLKVLQIKPGENLLCLNIEGSSAAGPKQTHYHSLITFVNVSTGEKEAGLSLVGPDSFHCISEEVLLSVPVLFWTRSVLDIQKSQLIRERTNRLPKVSLIYLLIVSGNQVTTCFVLKVKGHRFAQQGFQGLERRVYETETMFVPLCVYVCVVAHGDLVTYFIRVLHGQPLASILSISQMFSMCVCVNSAHLVPGP